MKLSKAVWILVVAVWLVSFLWVEGQRLWQKYSVRRESRPSSIEQVTSGKVLIQTDDVFWWMQFNFRNYPRVASRILMSEKVPEGFSEVIKVGEKVEVVRP